MRGCKTIFLVISLSLFSCKQLYDYQTGASGDYLVVGGMITSHPGPCSVTPIKRNSFE